jgi:hypothetical protein
MTRREFLEIAAALAMSSRVRAARDDRLDDAIARAAGVIRGYSAEGFHRTATAVDRASAGRLLALARAAGAAPSLEPFELSRVDPGAQFVEIDGRRIDGLAMFDGPFTDAHGVRGPIGAAADDRPIAFARVAPDGEAALARLRAAARQRAIVVATVGAKPGLCPVNAARFSNPFGPPVLQVASEHAEALERASRAGAAARVVAQAARHPATAFNVVATVPGARRDLPPVCVMTPRSGWHANASERGGGLACWLEAVRAVTPARPMRDVRFVASSGHELGHLGLHAYLDRNPTLARGAFAWVHLGANIGASTGEVRMSAFDTALAAAARAALARQRLDDVRQAPAGQVAGEAATISEQGGRFVSFIGRNAWFHNPRDLWPDAVDVNAVARFARAVADLTLALANTAQP